MINFIDKYVYEIIYRYVFEMFMEQEGTPIIAISVDESFFWIDGLIE